MTQQCDVPQCPNPATGYVIHGDDAWYACTFHRATRPAGSVARDTSPALDPAPRRAPHRSPAPGRQVSLTDAEVAPNGR